MKNPTGYRQIFLYVAPFVPLAFFKIWASVAAGAASLFPVDCAMLVYCLFILALAWRWDEPSYFDWTVSAYFLTVVILLFLRPEPARAMLGRYPVTGIYLCLFAASFLPPVFGFAPFTIHYAKKYTPQILWDNPVFLTINRTMTYTWALIFGVCALLSLYPSVVTRAIYPLMIIVGVEVPFNIRFPDLYLKRHDLPPLASMRAEPGNPAAEGKATLSPGSREPASDQHYAPVLNNVHKETAMEQRNPVPRPDSIESFMTIMSSGFRPERAAQMKAVMQFTFSGQVEGICHFEIDNGEIRAKEGASAKPDLIIESPFEIWMDVITGKADGQEMFMQQKYRASGDFSLLLRMNQLFGRD